MASLSGNTALVAVLLCGFIAFSCADVYMHNPRGSNNRLNERSANRNNADRLFDSQNNNRGGYNKGDRRPDTGFQTYAEQYDMNYLTNNRVSILGFEWTNQHGCGGNELGDPWKLNCEIILQYVCYPENSTFDKTREDCTKECFVPTPNITNCINPGCPIVEMDEAQCTANGYQFLKAQYFDEFNCPHKCNNAPAMHSRATCEAAGGTWQTISTDPTLMRLRDGLTTTRQSYTNPNNNQLTPADDFTRKDGDDDPNLAYHESWEFYDQCYRREANRGLFVADQNLQANSLGYTSAVFTRQNPNNNRRGYECPEERDYYPYWHPSPWRDIVIMTDRLDLCSFYQSESQNVKGKGMCFSTATCNNCIRYNNPTTCAQNGGRWATVPAFGIAPPQCIQAPWSRVNHLGNGRHGQALSYNWTLPYLPNGPQRCAVRLRYNISTDDYDAWRVNASFNNNDGAGIKSPVRQNPNVDIGAANQALQLAINTAQFGRTFQDRSHAFRLVPRPGAGASANRLAATGGNQSADFFASCQTLYNLNVRGKRGNIVQTFPAVEYDFYPNHLHLTTNDCVHVQWTGSNTHNNGNPAGDGQAGDAGEGTGGTDRHNFVEMSTSNFDSSFPLPSEQFSMMTNLKDAFDPSGQYDAVDLSCCKCDRTQLACRRGCWTQAKDNWALRMASVGYYDSFDCPASKNALTTATTQLNTLLNNANASYLGGVFKFQAGLYQYMCTRNNNFSNRDQKGKLLVKQA